MTRRSFADVDAVARADERCSVEALAIRRGEQLRAFADAGRIGREEADFAARQVRAFADNVLTGLHLERPDEPKVREAVRRLRRQRAAKPMEDGNDRS